MWGVGGVEYIHLKGYKHVIKVNVVKLTERSYYILLVIALKFDIQLVEFSVRSYYTIVS